MHNDRRPQPKGPVEWDLVNPITIEEVTKAIKGMSDGPQGRIADPLEGCVLTVSGPAMAQ